MLHIRANHAEHLLFVPPLKTGEAQNNARLPRLLIVDDDPQVLRVARRLLRKTWRVETASNAADAALLLKERWFDAVLSDYDMPGNNGLWLLKTAQQYQPHIRRVLFSGSGPTDLSAHLQSGLVHCFVAKPPGRDELADSLRWNPVRIRN